MTCTASSSISSRSSADGHRSPRMCSLSASPVPTPRAKPPSVSSADVAAAWATMAGPTRAERARHRGRDGQRAGLGDRPDRRPDQRAVALLVQPRMGSGRRSTGRRTRPPARAGPAAPAHPDHGPRSRGSSQSASSLSLPGGLAATFLRKGSSNQRLAAPGPRGHPPGSRSPGRMMCRTHATAPRCSSPGGPPGTRGPIRSPQPGAFQQPEDGGPAATPSGQVTELGVLAEFTENPRDRVALLVGTRVHQPRLASSATATAGDGRGPSAAAGLHRVPGRRSRRALRTAHP